MSTEERHPSLDDRFDPAVRIVDYDAAADPRPSALRRCDRASGTLRPAARATRVPVRAGAGVPDFHYFARPPERPRTYHLHVCEAGSAHEFRHVAVRDFLRAHDDEATRYAALKRRLAARHPQDRLAYIEGKRAYVAALEARAVSWARERG